jgi:acyl-CoA hydrolase
MDKLTPEMRARADAAETRIAKVVAPGTTNNYDTLFGGILLAWMDEVAFITATRFGRCRFVTVSIERTDFKHPIPSGTIVELVGQVESLGRTSVKIRVDVFIEEMLKADRLKAVSGSFTMVAIDEHRRPTPIEPKVLG